MLSLNGSNMMTFTGKHINERGCRKICGAYSELMLRYFASASNDNDGLDSLDVNAILGSAPSTSRNSSAANTASLKSTAEAFNR